MPRLLLAVLILAASLAAQAQSWPAKPVRVIVAFAAGGSTDVAVRSIRERLSQSLGQPVIVENRPGAAGNIAADYVVKQPADGHTVLASADSLASNPHLFKNLTFDPAQDLVPVVQLTRQPVVLAVHTSLGVRNGQLAGIKLTHVPYKGGGQAVNDLVGGQVPIGSLGNTPLLPHHRSGRIRIIAQTTAARSQSLPEVPTYQEAGMRGGLEPVSGTPADIQRQYRADYAKYGRLIKELNIRLE